MKIDLHVETDDELYALGRAIMEAKFSGNADDELVPASSLVASVAKRLAAALTSRRPDWGTWFHLTPDRPEWRSALLHTISQRRWWKSANATDRRSYIEALLAPFVTSDASIALFEQHADKIIDERGWIWLWVSIESSACRVAIVKPDPKVEGNLIVEADGGICLLSSHEEQGAFDWLHANHFLPVAYRLTDTGR